MTKTLDHEGNRQKVGSARNCGLLPTAVSPAAEEKVRGHWPWVTCLDQFGTRLAYHGVPESHMKTVVYRLKCYAPKYLAGTGDAVRTVGESRATEKPTAITQVPQEAISMVDLEQVKVTPRDQQVLNLLVEGCCHKEIAGQLNRSPRTVKQRRRTLFLPAGIREGGKRVKLAIAIFAKEEAQS